MTQFAQDLVAAIAEGDSVSIDNAFNAAMAEKISARLDDMRQDVAKNMFAEASCGSKKKMKESESCDDEDSEDEDEKEMKEEIESSVDTEQE
jgi:hypothetical protein